MFAKVFELLSLFAKVFLFCFSFSKNFEHLQNVSNISGVIQFLRSRDVRNYITHEILEKMIEI